MKAVRWLNVFVALALLLALLPAGTPAQAQTPTTPPNKKTPVTKPVPPQPADPGMIKKYTPGTRSEEVQFVPGELVVMFDQELGSKENLARATSLAGALNASVKRQNGKIAVLSLASGADLNATTEKIKSVQGVKYAGRNYVFGHDTDNPTAPKPPDSPETKDDNTVHKKAKKTEKLTTFPNDLFNTWGSITTKQFIIWPEKTPSPVVCIVDSGVDATHPDLKGRVVKGYDFVNDDAIPDDDNGHGTFIAGIIAANTNNAIGISGISNGKVMAVKGLGAEGWGTSADLFLAIDFCAKQSSVKVINLSWGGRSPDYLVYLALDEAINTYHKLVVAAAGNATTSNEAYPAAWSDPTTSSDGYGGANNISDGIISASSTAAPQGLITWVDTNGDRMMTYDEMYDFGSSCAAPFADYGDWVDLLVPGESLYSLTPFTSPFYDYYNGYVDAAYGTMSGSSFAAAYASGAAARAWSVNQSYSNENMKILLKNSGDYPYLASDGYNFDQGDYTSFDPNAGYWQRDIYGNQMAWNIDGESISYGDVFWSYNQDDGYYWQTLFAPYCWPSASNKFGSHQGNENSRVLNLARAMRRAAIEMKIRDATTGMPLAGASVMAKDYTGRVVTTGYIDTAGDPYTYLLNLQVEDSFGQTGYFQIFVNKPGYTAGPVNISNFGYIYTAESGTIRGDSQFDIGIPPIGKTIGIVATYNEYFDHDPDLVVFTPYSSDSWQRWVVGPDALWGSYPPDYVGTGSLLYSPGPRMRYSTYETRSMETVMISNYPRSTSPFYYYNGNYTVFINSNDEWDLYDANPIVRIWSGGKITSFVEFSESAGCDTGETWWRAGWLSPSFTGKFKLSRTCGTSALWPWQ